MLFNSWTFALFALIVFALYYVLPFRLQNVMLLAASYVFYGAWDYRFLSLILLSTLIDYLVGLGLARLEAPGSRKLLLSVSCVANLGILGFFKYCNFFLQSLEVLLSAAGIQPQGLWLPLLLPVGISFYTFQAMSYTIDVYYRKLAPTRDLLNFALFIAYFPQLVAGPIERAVHLLPQLERPRTIRRQQCLAGAWLILVGLFEKVVVADNLAIIVNEAFGAPTAPSGPVCLLAVYAFAFQIYCDFAGYSDIARGLGKLMGIELMKNFDRPYLATNPQEFWRRWHISLSTWLRDYLYIPLGGDRCGRDTTYRNILLVMLLGGLWHGAEWKFVLWGLYHGGLLALHRWLVRERPNQHSTRVSAAWRWLSRAGMFHLTCFGWLLFRAKGLEQVGVFLRRIFGDCVLGPEAAESIWFVTLFAGLCLLLEWWRGPSDDPRDTRCWRTWVGPLAVTALGVLLVILAPPRGMAFLYFQF